MNLLLLQEGDALESGRVALEDGRAAHLLSVLKVVPGQTVRVGIVDGPIGVGTVESADQGRVTLQCVFSGGPPERPRVDLLLALPRPKVLRRLWAPLASLGVGRIILTNAERVERHYFDTHLLEPAGYRPLLIEGLQQARDTRLPLVSIHRQLKILIEDRLDSIASGALRLVADPGSTTAVAAAMPSGVDRRVLLAVGPEGGWNAFELALLRDHGFEAVGLGPRPLRVDTACIALLAIVHAALGTASLH